MNKQKVRHLVQELLRENPMFATVTLKWRKFTLGATGKTLGMVWLALFAVALVGCFQFAVLLAQPQAGFYVALIKVILLALATPFLTHGVIASEREKRTWDSLISAPVTIGQIVIGKFAGIVTIIGLIFAVAMPLEIVAPLSSLMMPTDGIVYPIRRAQPYEVIDAMITYARFNWYGFTFCIAWAALNFFFSARSKRALSALATSIAILFVFSVATMPLQYGDSAATSGILIAPFSPFAMSSFMIGGRELVAEFVILKILPEFSSLILLVITGLLLFYSFKTVTFADREVKFLPQRPNARS